MLSGRIRSANGFAVIVAVFDAVSLIVSFGSIGLMVRLLELDDGDASGFIALSSFARTFLLADCSMAGPLPVRLKMPKLRFLCLLSSGFSSEQFRNMQRFTCTSMLSTGNFFAHIGQSASAGSSMAVCYKISNYLYNQQRLNH